MSGSRGKGKRNKSKAAERIISGITTRRGFYLKRNKRKGDKKMATTLLSYFRDGLKKQGRTAKYLNRDFLGVFIAEYNSSKRAGAPLYEKAFATDFYSKNGGDYCAFLEMWNKYRAGMDRIGAWKK